MYGDGAMPHDEHRASSNLAVTKAIFYQFESPIRFGRPSLQFSDGLFALYTFSLPHAG